MASHTFDFRGYHVRVFLERIGNDSISGRAELFAAAGAPSHQITLPSPRPNAETALVELACRARSFIENEVAR